VLPETRDRPLRTLESTAYCTAQTYDVRRLTVMTSTLKDETNVLILNVSFSLTDHNDFLRSIYSQVT
jgi:hypothetical protein